MDHGTVSGYRHHGCRCEPCTRATYRDTKLRKAGVLRNRLVDATGIRRRIQALYRMGWDSATIGARIGGKSQDAVSVLTSRRKVNVRTAETIARIYDELAMTIGPSAHARKLAIRRGLPGPLAWDDHTIDDPAAEPHVGKEGGLGSGRRLIHLEDVEFLLARDAYTWEGLATRLGVTRSSLERHLYRHRRHDLTQQLNTNTRGYRKATA